jgi:hypothetical protein
VSGSGDRVGDPCGICEAARVVVEGVALVIKSKPTGKIKHITEICNPPINKLKDYTDFATDSPMSFTPVGNIERSSLLESMSAPEIYIC